MISSTPFSCCFCSNILSSKEESENVDQVKVFAEHMKEVHKTLTNSVICFVISVLEEDDIALLNELLASYNKEGTEDKQFISCWFCEDNLEMIQECGGDFRLTKGRLPKGYLGIFPKLWGGGG